MPGYGSVEELIAVDIAGGIYTDATVRAWLIADQGRIDVLTSREVQWKRKDENGAWPRSSRPPACWPHTSA